MDPPWRWRARQSLRRTVVHGDVYQIQAGGEVNIHARQAPYRIVPLTPPPPLTVGMARAQPSRLLLARHAVVPFAGRTRLRRDLHDWLGTPEATGVRLLHAPGGQGKTRLADQVAREAQTSGWRAVWVAHGLGPVSQQPTLLPAARERMLLLVDYADRWPGADLEFLVQEAHAAAAGAYPTRLLLARSAGFWWSALADAIERDTGVLSEEFDLPPLSAEVDPTVMFTEARNAFGAVLKLDVSAVVPPADLCVSDRAHVLDVHMAALVAVGAYRDGRQPPSEPGALSRHLLRRERAYWNKILAGAGSALGTPPTTMARVVFVATLTGAMARCEAVTALADAGVVSDGDRATAAIDQHRICYPSADPRTVLEPLHPDQLGEDFLALSIPDPSGRVTTDGDCADDWADTAAASLVTGTWHGRNLHLPDHTARVVTVLIEVAARWPHVAKQQLVPLLRAQPWLALAAGNAAMTRLATMDLIGLDLLETIETAVDGWNHVGVEAGVAAIAQRLCDARLATVTDPVEEVDLRLHLARRLHNGGQLSAAGEVLSRARQALTPLSGDSDRYPPRLAAVMSRLGAVLTDLRRTDEAVAATTTAVEAYRQLAKADPAQYQPALITALGRLGWALAGTGRWQRALAATQEAVALGRALATGSGRSDLDLADLLSALCGRLADLGRFQDAVEAGREAVALLVGHAQANGIAAGHEPDLAVALNNLGAALLGLGHCDDEALHNMQTLITLRRSLAAANPQRYEPELAGSLNNLAGLLLRMGRWRDGVDAAGEATDICRRLAPADPVRLEPELAGVLATLSGGLTKAGQWEQASAVAVEAVDLYRQLARRNPGAYTPRLAMALLNLGTSLSTLGRVTQASAASAEAASLFRELMPSNPDRLASDFALALTNHGHDLAELGQIDEAHSVTAEAITILRTSTDAGSEHASGLLAQALTNQCGNLAELGQSDAARNAGAEAVTIYRRLMAAAPDAIAPDLALALGALAGAHLGVGDRAQARQALEESLAIYRRLSVGHPRSYTPKVVTTLGNLGIVAVADNRPEAALAYAHEAVEIATRLARQDTQEQRSILAEALLKFAQICMLTKEQAQEALEAARQAMIYFEQLAANHPGASTRGLRQAHAAVAEINGLLANRRAAGSVTGFVIADEVRRRLGPASLAQVCASLFPVDCMSCEQPLGQTPTTLHVDDFGAFAVARLHHERCKPSAWNGSDTGVMILKFNSAVRSTWTSLSAAVPVTDPVGRVLCLPLIVINPSLEMVRLDRTPDGRWAVRPDPIFRTAGLTGDAVSYTERLVDGVQAIRIDDTVLVAVDGHDDAYETPYFPPEAVQRLIHADRVLVAITHAVNPSASPAPRDLAMVLRGDRTLLGWVRLDRQP